MCIACAPPRPAPSPCGEESTAVGNSRSAQYRVLSLTHAPTPRGAGDRRSGASLDGRARRGAPVHAKRLAPQSSGQDCGCSCARALLVLVGGGAPGASRVPPRLVLPRSRRVASSCAAGGARGALCAARHVRRGLFRGQRPRGGAVSPFFFFFFFFFFMARPSPYTFSSACCGARRKGQHQVGTAAMKEPVEPLLFLLGWGLARALRSASAVRLWNSTASLESSG